METIEDVLTRQMNTPVAAKGGGQLLNEDGSVMMPVHAIVKSIVNSAMHGDLAATAFINNFTKKKDTAEDVAYRKQQEQQMLVNEQAIRDQLEADGLYDPTMQYEVERLANTLLIVQRLEAEMREPGHQDVELSVGKFGETKAAINRINDFRQKQLEQFNKDLQLLRSNAQIRAQVRRRNKKQK